MAIVRAKQMIPAEGVGGAWRNWFWMLLVVLVLLKGFHFLVAEAAAKAGVVDAQFAMGYPMVAWDSLHYLQIMRYGYPDAVAGRYPETVAFFPLLPLFTRPVAMLLNGPAAMLLVCNAASVTGVMFFFLWSKRKIGPRLAFWASLLLLAYPPAMFLSAAYTEPLFCATTAAALYFADMERPWLAALMAGLGSAARPTGIVVSLAVWIDAIVRGTPGQRMRHIGKWVLVGMLSVGGLILFGTYLTYRYGTPLAYVYAQENFVPAARVPGAPVATAQAPLVREDTPAERKWVRKIESIGAWGTMLAYVMAGISILIVIPKMPWGRHIMAIPLLIFLIGYLPNMGARVNSCSRFMTCGLPLFAVVVTLPWVRRRPWLLLPVLASGVVVQGMFVWGFTRGVWAG